MNKLEEEQGKLISLIYQEIGIETIKNKKSISDIEFEIALAARVNHTHQISFLEHHLEGFLKNKKLIDKLSQLLIDFESKGLKKNG